MIKEINVTTGEEIVRDLNSEEITELKESEAAAKALKVEIQANIEARQALLDKLGITADEAQLLLG